MILVTGATGNVGRQVVSELLQRNVEVRALTRAPDAAVFLVWPFAESSFHHFADYNWAPEAGCPTFVVEPPGGGMTQNLQAPADIRRYVRNVALWLAGA